jgi:type IV fimbrial biogenesis protein FimT
MRRPLGFTLIELLVAIAILAIVISLGAPSFSQLIADYRLRSATEGMMNGIQLARTEAINRNTNVSFTLSAGGGWSIAVVSPSATIQTRPAGESGSVSYTTNGSYTSLTFTPTGMVSAPSTSLSQITVAATGTSKTYQVNIYGGGAARMCQPSITTANDPRKC